MSVSFASGQPFYDHVLTDFYLPVFADARNNSAVLWSLIPKGRRRVAGKHIVFPVHDGRNYGGNAIMPSGDLPSAGHQGSKFYAFPYRHYFHSIGVDGATIDASKDDGGSWADVIDHEVNGAFDDIIVDQNRMLHNDGSGRLAVVDDASIGATDTFVTVAINPGIESASSCPTDPTKFLPIGKVIAFCASDGTMRGSATVTGITANVVTCSATQLGSGGLNVQDGDWIVAASAGNYTSVSSENNTGYRAEPQGIGGIYSDIGLLDGNAAAVGQTGSARYTGVSASWFQGIVVGANAFNQAVVNDNTGSTRPLSEDLLQQVLSDAEELNNANVDVLLSSYSTYNSYFSLLKGDKRYVNTLELAGGHKVLTFNGIGWVKDRHTYGGRVYGLGLDQFYLYEVVPLEWVDNDGLKFRKVSGKDDWEASLKTRYTVGVDVRQRAGFVLVDLAA